MKMDWGTAIVGLISILICIVPFVIMYYKRIKKENKMLQSLNEIAQQHHCKINQHEFCGDFVLGIDENRKFVFFFKHKKEEEISQFVDLSEIQICQVVKIPRHANNNIGNLNFIERVELSFTPTNKNKKEARFELYDEDINMQLSGELQFVEKWAKQINDCLKNKK
jgi:ABC-type glycerol-3-phosphate transport system permease component